MNVWNCITLAFIGVLKPRRVANVVSANCITLAFIGVLKHDTPTILLYEDCITLAFIGVLKLWNCITVLIKLLYHIGVYRGIKTHLSY